MRGSECNRLVSSTIEITVSSAAEGDHVPLLRRRWLNGSMVKDYRLRSAGWYASDSHPATVRPDVAVVS